MDCIRHIVTFFILAISPISLFAQDDWKPYRDPSTDKYGYTDTSGKIVIQPQFDWANEFSEGLACVEKGKWGYIDKSGVFVIQPQFDRAISFSEELALVEINDRWGYIDKTGKIVIQPQFDYAYKFSEMLAAAKNGKWGYIDKSGVFVIQPQFDDVNEFSEGLAAAKKGGSWGYIDKSGKFIIKPQFDDVNEFSEGLAAARKGDNWGYIDKSGKFVIKPQFYYRPQSFCEGLASVKKDDIDGYIDKTGRWFDSEAEGKEYIQSEKRNQILSFGSLQNYISATLDTWDNYLKNNGIRPPTNPDKETIAATVQADIEKWQQKGEFETTAAWQARVNEQTRNARAKQLAEDEIKRYNDQVDSYNFKVEILKNKYQEKYAQLAKEYCRSVAEDFLNQGIELKPYDADNGTFLISTERYGDILLPVPMEQAPAFKQNWESIRKSAIVTFIPSGNDVALSSITFADYTYDSNTKAEYAQVDVDYKFRPIDLSAADISYDFADIVSAENIAPAIKTPEAKTIAATKVTPDTRKVTAGNASDVDTNIPQSKDIARNTFAVIIANTNYKNASTATYATNDGKVMKEYFNKALGIPEKQIYIELDASFGSMRGVMSQLKDISQAYNSQPFNLIFYYVGHGMPSEDGSQSYLLPVDAIPSIPETCISLNDLYSTLGSLGAATVTVMLDACFSGVDRNDKMFASNALGVRIKPRDTDPTGNMVILSAAQKDQTAYPFEEQGHNLFSYYILKKLQEASGRVTIGELAKYVSAEVSKESIITNKKLQQPSVATSITLGSTWTDLPLVR